MEHIDETTIILEKITESDQVITFNPPLVVQIYKVKKQTHTEYADVVFDFGLRTDVAYENWLTSKVTGDWIEKTKKVIEFELFHAFHHIHEDPNYGTLHWALFGNLAHRVECGELISFGDEPDELEKWKYTKDFRRIYG